MGFSRQEYLSGLSFPFPRDLPDPEIEPRSPSLAGRFFTTEPPGKLSHTHTHTHVHVRAHTHTHTHAHICLFSIIILFVRNSVHHMVHGVLKARILKWFAIPFSSGPHSVRPLHHDLDLEWPHMAWLSFIELDKAVVHVIRLASCLWL